MAPDLVCLDPLKAREDYQELFCYAMNCVTKTGRWSFYWQ